MTNPNPITLLSPQQFCNMLKMGAQRIISRESFLNKLNVFPVSDHDTGTNVAALMKFLSAYELNNKDFNVLFQQIADASLIGAAGNSGIIFSAYFSGFASITVRDPTALSISEFFACIQAATKAAYGAVSRPVEGTILTVMKAWFTSCERLIAHINDYLHLFELSVVDVAKSLKETEQQNDLLKQHHVVDAGANAFFLLVEGMHEYLLDPLSADWLADTETGTVQVVDHEHEESAHFRYCFESILLSCTTDQAIIKAALDKLGDSIVINKSPSYLKIHFHTDDVMSATRYLQTVGHIFNQKIDDMRKQVDFTQQAGHKIALVTDSSADLPAEFIAAHAIHVIPIVVRIGQDNLLDRLTVNLQELYTATDVNGLTAATAVPSAETMMRQLSHLASHYDSIIVMTLSSKLSSFNEHINNLTKKMPKTRISVIDSKRTSAAQGMLVMKAATLIEKGMPHDDVVDYINRLIDRTNIYVSIHNFHALARSGRAPKMVAAIANTLHFNPVISCDNTGKVGLTKIAFGLAMSESRLLEVVKQTIKPNLPYTISVVHSNAREKAEKLAMYLDKQMGIKTKFIAEIAASVGVHAGQYCVAIVVMQDTI